MRKLQFFIPLLLAFCVTFTAAAQTDCPSIVKAALDTVDSACFNTGRNQVCYGNIVLNATPRAGVSDFTFTKTGDEANVSDIQSLQLSSMSLTDNSWGVALMELQANLPDTVPGQNVTFLLFGDVQIDNAAVNAPQITLTLSDNANVRLRPTTSGNNIMTSLKKGQTVVATGRLADSSWIEVKVEGDTRGVGWVSANLLDGDLSSLAVVRANEPTWGPMQSFYFTTGVGDRPCDQAPDSGILIQTPKGAGRVTLEANDVEITLGSTVYLQAQPNDFLTATVVEGEATPTSGGQTQTVPAGTYSRVHLDSTSKATGKPSIPKPYDKTALATLPLGVKAFTPITIADPLTIAQIKAATETVSDSNTSANTTGNSNSGLHPSGSWYQTNVITANRCINPPPSPESGKVGDVHTWYSTLIFSDDQQTVSYQESWSTRSYQLSRVSDNVYHTVFYDAYSNSVTVSITFTSVTSYQVSSAFTSTDGTCVYDYEGHGSFAR